MHPAPRRPVRTTIRRTVGALAVLGVAATLTGAVPGDAPATAAGHQQVCSAPDFRDVPETSPFYEAITWLRCEQISVGYADGTYAPGRQITRGETAQLLYRFSGEEHDPGTRRDFTDVRSESSAFTAVSWMQEKGYSRGYADGSFGVNRPITRGEVSAFMFRMSGAENPEAVDGESVFPDMETDDTFYHSAAWFRQEGLASGYADGTFRPGRNVTRGETAKFLYGLETYLHGEPAGSSDRPGSTGLAANPTGGSGGSRVDAARQLYGNGTVSSNYHLYASHLRGKAPHGVIFYLHGDGGWEYSDRKDSPTAKYVQVAREHNLMLVVPKTPAADGTWWGQKTSGAYATDLLDHLGTRYDLDLNRIYWVGFSGGADVITEQVVQSHSDGWTGGGALILGGGPGEWGYLGKKAPLSDALKKNFPMHWVVGADDTPSRGGSSGNYDALRAAKDGHSYYAGRGMRTSIEIIPDAGHVKAAWAGPGRLDAFLSRR